MTKIYGHRGAKGSYPENTLLSFKKAIELGVDGLELDVHLTKDGEVVVIHDETLDRTTNGKGWVKDLTLAEIKKASAGCCFKDFPKYDVSWDDEKVPTLEEVLELLTPYSIELNIELKTDVVPYEGIEEKVHEIVQQYNNGRKVVYSSFHLPTILRMKKVNPQADIAWLLNEGISLPMDFIQTLGLEALHVNKTILLPDTEVYERILQNYASVIPNGVKHYLEQKLQNDPGETFQSLYDMIRVWTVNDPAEMSQLFSLKVEALMTDFPARAIGVRDVVSVYSGNK